MTYSNIADEVLRCVGGTANVASNALCMTRLRLVLKDPSVVDRESLLHVPGVLGLAKHGECALEIVFGPNKIRPVFNAVSERTGLEDALAPLPVTGPAEPLKVQIMSRRRINLAKGAAGAGGDNAGDAGDGSEAASSAAQNALDHKDELLGRMHDLLGGGLDDLTKLLDESDLSEDDIDDLVDEDDIVPVGSGTAVASGLAGEFDDSDVDELESLLQNLSGGSAVADAPLSLLVINGPNINMLGIREPGLYGKEDYAALLELCQKTAREVGFAECVCYQSNHEGDLVDMIQDAYQTFDGIVINPGAYTHTSIAILDALKSVSIPCIEVHISKVSEREEFRQVSYVRLACFETIMGEGIAGYAHAIRDMWDHLS